MSAEKKISYYDFERMETVESEREYIETHNIIEYGEDVGDYWSTVETRRIPAYLDVKSGLVVHDIPAYEKWLSNLVNMVRLSADL